MFLDDSNYAKLDVDQASLAESICRRLKTSTWPFKFNELPFGSALVGGSIRDCLLDRHKHKPDLDVVVPSNALKLAKDLSEDLGGTFVLLDEERGIARLISNSWTIDFATQIGSSLEEDLFRRDFTINSIALVFSNHPKIIDPTGGLNDLRHKKLVAVKEQNLIDDPLRLLRGFRLSAELGFALDEDTKKFVQSNSALLHSVARERIKTEIEKLVQADWADEVIPFVKQSQLLEPWESTDKLSISLKNVSALNTKELEIALPLVRLTDLLSDQGLDELSFSRKKLQNCHYLRYWFLKNDGFSFENLTEDDRLKLHKDLETFLPALILQLPFEDQQIWLDRWRDNGDPLFHPFSPIDGFSLQKMFGASQGPWIGQLMNLLCKENAFGRINNREEAFHFARYWWEHNQPFCD